MMGFILRKVARINIIPGQHLAFILRVQSKIL